jgi:hypothetical protein
MMLLLLLLKSVFAPEMEECMQKLIKNNWCRKSGEPFDKIIILDHKTHPEGLDIHRMRFFEHGTFAPKANVGHIISVLRGDGNLHIAGDNRSPFRLTSGVHLYVPSGMESTLSGTPGTELLCVSGASASQTRGRDFLLRDETFVAACASGSQ